MEDRTRFNKALEEIFSEISDETDSSGHDTINLRQFEAIVTDEDIQKEFSMLGIEIEKDNTLQIFQMLDVENAGRISYEQFHSGIYRMHGSAKSIDMAQLIVNSTRTV